MRQVISIPDRKIGVIEHLKGQVNMSGYIVSLIEKDMKNQLLSREEIIRLIKEHTRELKQSDLDLLDSVQNVLDF